MEMQMSFKTETKLKLKFHGKNKMETETKMKGETNHTAGHVTTAMSQKSAPTVPTIP